MRIIVGHNYKNSYATLEKGYGGPGLKIATQDACESVELLTQLFGEKPIIETTTVGHVYTWPDASV